MVEAYNNVIYRVGTGPDPVEAASDYAGVYVVQETDNDGSVGKGQVDVYNNTFYNCGTLTSNSTASAIHLDTSDAPNLTLRLRNNVIVGATAAERYVVGTVSGSNNLTFGGTGSAGGATGTLTTDPLLVAPMTADFHLGAGSPAIDQGIDIGLADDLDGNARPLGAAFDIGAYERAP